MSARPRQTRPHRHPPIATSARKVVPPDIDVRAAVRGQIEEENRRKIPAGISTPTVWEELLTLAGFTWMRGALAGCALAAVAADVFAACELFEVVQVA